ncbi:MAG: hypothetical protein HRU15_14995 [Planctomycetes bacterium]|nr:hypothetical protein [Planctomycetota bacterium]
MARSRTRKDKENHSPSRLEVVQKNARDKAVFWDRTSISGFLIVLACVGILATIIGLMGLNKGELRVSHHFQLSYAISGWRYVTICICMVVFGLNLILPLALFLTIKERLAVLICSITMGINFVIFMYAFVVDVVARSEFYLF